MKQYSLLFLLVISGHLILAQDIIVKHNGMEVKAKIIEITDEIIKYKEFEYQNGPIRNVNTSDVFMIIYENGKRELITQPSPSTEKESERANFVNPKRRGFIGLELGSNIPIGKFADVNDGAAKTGLQLNLINFGYQFTENMGVTATWYGVSNSIIGTDYSYTWSIGGVLVGSLFTFPLSKNTMWDIKPMLGFSTASVTNSIFTPTKAFTFNFGSGLRINISRLIALTINAEYTTAKYKWDFWQQSMEAIIIKGGFAFRLK